MVFQCFEIAGDAGEALFDCVLCVEGRRPGGLVRACRARSSSTVGAYFARAAHLEAASVEAFRILRDELAAHGAPAHLVRACERAALDEVRHTRMTTALARRYGAIPAPARVDRRPVRSLEAIAIENAVEGCVRETYGALVAMFQARAARDPRVRATMARIASDETRHAALGWQIAAWSDARLECHARRRVSEATRGAVEDLRAGARNEPPAPLSLVAGLPRAAQAARMVNEMSLALWA